MTMIGVGESGALFTITFPSPQDFFPINLPATAGSGDLETLLTPSPPKSASGPYLEQDRH